MVLGNSLALLLQFEGLRVYAARAGLDIVQDFCDVGASGRR